MQVTDIIGQFSISGTNQDETSASYEGTLSLKLSPDGRIKAHWFINGDQIQKGTGFFKNNILVLNFKYTGEDKMTYKGVAVYRCLSKDILDGFWSEKYGDPLYLGEERCFRIKSGDMLLD